MNRIFLECPLIQIDAFYDILEMRTSARYRKCDILRALNQMEEIGKIKVRRRQGGLLGARDVYCTLLADKTEILNSFGFEDWSQAESRILQELEKAKSIREKYSKHQLESILLSNCHLQ